MKIKYLLLVPILFIQSNIQASESEKIKITQQPFEILINMVKDLNDALVKVNYCLVDDVRSSVRSHEIDIPLNPDKETLLIKAVKEKKDLNLIKLLLEFGADPEKTDCYKFNAIAYAKGNPIILAEIKHREELKKILNENEYQNFVKLNGELEVDFGYSQAYELLREYMTTNAQIIRAVKKGDLEKIESILNDPNIKRNINDIVDANGKTPLIWAFIFNKPNIINYFLDNGADYQMQDNSGKSFEDYIKGIYYYEKIFTQFKKRKESALNQALPSEINGLQNIVLQYL